MASLIPGFLYDVFISYRQKDNKGDKWVSEFVDALRTELDKTFKEEISVYYDVNPHDGLLDTHDVDASLREKLKSLILIPVISRTYCDPKSFAWEHEFTAFAEMASRDKLGLKIRLPDGNVGSRILPVRIHDLEIKDVKLCESVLGGPLRGVEFIYREPGVNRPMSRFDNDLRNLNGTRYQNQINRVANAIRDIIAGMRSETHEYQVISGEVPRQVAEPELTEKSIIVLPFHNLSSDSDQEYFSDGLTDEVIADLSNVPDLLVISRSSAMSFKDTRSTVREIAEKVNVRYVLEGSVRKASNNLRITAELIDSSNDSHLWAEKYNGTLEDVFDIQERVSQSIVNALKIRLSSKDKKKILERPIDNVFAYDCYRRAYPEITSFAKERIENGLKLLHKGLDIAGPNAVIFAGIAYGHFQLLNAGVEQDLNTRKAEEFLNKAFELNNDLAEAHFVMGCICSLSGRPEKAIEHALKAYAGKPEDPQILIWLALGFTLMGKIDSARALLNKCIKIDPINPLNESVSGWNYFYNGRFDLALDPLLNAYLNAPEKTVNQFWKAIVLFYNDQHAEASEFICSSIAEPGKDTWSQLSIFLKYVISKERNKLNRLVTPEFVRAHLLDPQNSYFIAAFYAYLGEKEEALSWLENAMAGGFLNYPFIDHFDPFLKSIRGEKRFKLLLEKVRNEWEKKDQLSLTL